MILVIVRFLALWIELSSERLENMIAEHQVAHCPLEHRLELGRLHGNHLSLGLPAALRQHSFHSPGHIRISANFRVQ
jgi:hypothetical protein